MSKYKLSHLDWNLSLIHVLNTIKVPTLSVYELSVCNTVRELCQLRDNLYHVIFVYMTDITTVLNEVCTGWASRFICLNFLFVCVLKCMLNCVFCVRIYIYIYIYICIQRSQPTRGGTISKYILTSSWQSAVHLSGFQPRSVQSGWTYPQYDRKAVTTTTEPNPSHPPFDGERRSNTPWPCSLSCMELHPHKQRTKLPVQHMYWIGAPEIVWNLICNTL